MNSDVRDQTTLPPVVTAASDGTEVTCRPNVYCLAAAEILIEEGVCPDQSTAVAWLCEAGLVSHRTLFFRAVDRVAAPSTQSAT